MFQRDGWGYVSQMVRVSHSATCTSSQSSQVLLDGPMASTGSHSAGNEKKRSKNGKLTEKCYHIKE